MKWRLTIFVFVLYESAKSRDIVTRNHFACKNNCNLKYFENIFFSMSILFMYIYFFVMKSNCKLKRIYVHSVFTEVNKSCQSGFN